MREFRELSIDLIDESDNIRRSFSEEKLRELAASIRQRGVLKPILVRPNGDRFTLIDGWRRLWAAPGSGRGAIQFLSTLIPTMADRQRRRRFSKESASRCRENDDRNAEVSSADQRLDCTAEDERLIRERLAEYFAILREWDLKLREDDTESSSVEWP